jgi:hypothetical protein
MLFVSLLRWWYGLGWLDQLKLVRDRFDRTADFFSIELSLRTLFKPFRQIDADAVRKGPLNIVLRAMFDQMFSRVFGAVVRSIMIVIGSVAILLEAVAGGLRLAVWPVIPLLPLIALPLMMTGWVPWL